MLLSFRLPDMVLALIFSFLLETERICTVMLVCRKWYDVIHGSTVSKKIDLRLEKYFWASAIIHQRMHVISLHTLPMRSANIILTWLSIPGADTWTTDLLTLHYACLNRLIALGTFVSAEDLWSHNLWKAHSLGAELHRGSVSRAVEVIFESKNHYSANFCTKTTPDFNTVRKMHK